MRVVVIGCGYVGLVSGSCLAQLGHQVRCIDVDKSRLNALAQGRMPIYEPGLEHLVAENVRAGRLSFGSDLAAAVGEAEVVLVAVGTPSRRSDGFADLSYVYACVREVAAALRNFTVVVTKSTVPVGTGDRIEDIIQDLRPDAEFRVASNPEFLREGVAIADFMKPDRIVIGSDDPEARRIMMKLYEPLVEEGAPLIVCSRRSAELSKYACNAFLATKLSFVNEMADLCERVGGDIRDITLIMGSDARIGRHFLAAGPGYGGSCLPKDVQALARTAQDHGSPLRIAETVAAVNEQRKRAVVRRIASACGGSLSGKTVTLLGLTFKADTDDMREAPSLTIATALQDAGATVRAYDPQGMGEARRIMPCVEFAADAYMSAQGVDAIVLVTEWPEFRRLDLRRLRNVMRAPVLLDLRNHLEPETAQDAGFTYHGLGYTSWALRKLEGQDRRVVAAA